MRSNFEIIYSIDEIDEVTGQLLQQFQNFKIFCFNGELGAGKTTFITSLCKSMGSEDQISSPTFSLINEYESPKGLIYHFDLYRIKNLEEAMDIGFEEYIYSKNYCFIEWPQKVTQILPKELIVTCQLTYLSLNQRKITAWANL